MHNIDITSNRHKRRSVILLSKATSKFSMRWLVDIAELESSSVKERESRLREPKDYSTSCVGSRAVLPLIHSNSIENLLTRRLASAS